MHNTCQQCSYVSTGFRKHFNAYFRVYAVKLVPRLGNRTFLTGHFWPSTASTGKRVEVCPSARMNIVMRKELRGAAEKFNDETINYMANFGFPRQSNLHSNTFIRFPFILLIIFREVATGCNSQIYNVFQFKYNVHIYMHCLCFNFCFLAILRSFTS